ncbi:MAG: ABC transporter permease [Clostridiales bacterium]|jgi:multidrug/hemolysin transport system permease protein|nr:ABC transporter permease [Clostridiales bacterium]
MREVLVMAERTAKLYLKNPLALLFSFVYLLLFVFLFALFLGDYMANAMAGIYAEVQGVNIERFRWLVDATSMSGTLMIGCILAPLNVLSVMVEDKSGNRFDSFLVSAVSRSKLVMGYWLAPFLIATLLNAISLFVIQGFIVASGGEWLSAKDALQLIGLIASSVFSSTSVFFIVAMLMKNASTYSTVMGILSAVVGLVTGAFLPVGSFPEGLQKAFAFLPAHHGAALMREVMAREPMKAVFGNVGDQIVKGSFMTGNEIRDIYAAENGIIYMFGQTRVPSPLMLAALLGSGALCLAIGVLWMKRYVK